MHDVRDTLDHLAAAAASHGTRIGMRYYAEVTFPSNRSFMRGAVAVLLTVVHTEGVAVQSLGNGHRTRRYRQVLREVHGACQHAAQVVARQVQGLLAEYGRERTEAIQNEPAAVSNRLFQFCYVRRHRWSTLFSMEDM